MLKQFRFKYGDHFEVIQARNIFDAMVEFHALFSDARLDVDDLTASRFDELGHLVISQVS